MYSFASLRQYVMLLFNYYKKIVFMFRRIALILRFLAGFFYSSLNEFLSALQVQAF
jgi:hypothetical protein